MFQYHSYPCLLLALLFLIHTPVNAANEAKKPGAPSIVIFIADDLSWHDVACFGGPTNAKTPHLDRLASEGMKLTGFFSPAAVCSPSRQALLTGLYPVRNGAYPNHSEVREGTRTLPHHLKPLGYRTLCVGKTHFGPKTAYPFDAMTGMLGENASSGNEDSGDGEIDTNALRHVLTEKKEQPFCLYVATHEPHGPWTKGDQSAYDPATLKLPPYLVDTPETRRSLAAYYAEVAVMDAQVGAVMDALEKTGHANDTLFFFLSEQGNSVPQGKWTLYDPGIRVAAIARWPGKIEAGSESSALIQYVDVLPTLIELAGGDPLASDTGCPDADGRRGFDGISFAAVLQGKAKRHRDQVFAQHTARGIIKGPEAYATRAVRDDHWKLILNLDFTQDFSNAISDGTLLQSWRKKGESGDTFAATQARRYTKRPAVELYDLHNDPWELTNVAEKKENEPTLARLKQQLDNWMKQQGDKGHQTEMEAYQHQAGKRKVKPKATSEKVSPKTR